jgi:NAD+ synthase
MKAEAVKNHIVQWLSDYAKRAKAKGFVVGVSGGIDSATTSTLCAETGLKVTLLNMNALSERYPNVSVMSVPLDGVFEAFKSAQALTAPEEELTHLALANSRARLRMSTLYYVAQCTSSLVAGTGNKVEDFGVGFYTKFGDGGVDVSPIADLTKTEVWDLGKYLGVDQEIIDAPPTDGLWGDNRSDEDQIGATYRELEWAMQMHEAHRSVDDFEGREREVYQIFLKFHQANKHKMDPIPVCEIPKELR